MKSTLILIVLVLGSIFLWKSAYIVYETEQVIITQFGKPVGKPITEAGLNWKNPFVHLINRIEKRTLEWDGRPIEMPTKDKTYIIVDTFARWSISNPTLFFEH